jgi:hypothetical protein
VASLLGALATGPMTVTTDGPPAPPPKVYIAVPATFVFHTGAFVAGILSPR